MQTSELIKKLSNSFGVSSLESYTFPVIEEELKNIVPDIKLEKIGIGNLIATYGSGKPKISFFAHVDEIGIVISKIIDEHFARLASVGGVDPRTLIGKRVVFKTANQEKIGVVGFLAPHLQKKEDRDKSPSFDELFIDFSISGGTKDLNVGDMGVIKTEAIELENNKITGKSLDNRVGCAVLIKSLEYLQKLRFDGQLILSFNKGEEVGLVGAKGSAEYINPDYAIVTDVTFGEKLPENIESINLGAGPAIAIGTTVDRTIFQELTKIAKDNNISYQVETITRRSGTEGDVVQIVNSGIKTGIVSVPILNMHSPNEVVDVKDIEETSKLLSLFALNVSVKEKGSSSK
jgi:endoglucanase